METVKYQGRIVELVEFEVEQGGKKMVFEKARRSPGVRLIIPKDGSILLSREERQEIGGYDDRLPGGKVFDTLEEYNKALATGTELKEAARQAAIREAREEVGIEVTDLTFFHKSVCGTTVEWDLFYFVVHNFTETTQELEAGEDISVNFIENEQVRRMCLDGSMSEERSALTLLRYLNT